MSQIQVPHQISNMDLNAALCEAVAFNELERFGAHLPKLNETSHPNTILKNVSLLISRKEDTQILEPFLSFCEQFPHPKPFYTIIAALMGMLVEHDNMNALRYVHKTRPAWFDRTDPSFDHVKQILERAAYWGRPHIIEWMSSLSSVSVPHHGEAMFMAAQYGRTAAARTLLDHPPVMPTSEEQKTYSVSLKNAALQAIQYKNDDMVELLTPHVGPSKEWLKYVKKASQKSTNKHLTRYLDQLQAQCDHDELHRKLKTKTRTLPASRPSKSRM